MMADSMFQGGRHFPDTSGDLRQQAERARALYESLLEAGELPDDRALARSGTYRDFLAVGLGMRMRMTRETFEHFVRNFYRGQAAASERAERHLSRLWAGLATMQIQ